METAKAVSLSIVNMAWESNMTRDQKEQYVLELYQQGRTIRHIAQLVHMSFTEIGRIIKRYKEEIERENGQMEEKGDDDYDVKSKSKTAKAIKLFSEGKNLVDVVIALDLQPDEVRAIYREFLQLKDMRELVELYDEMHNYLPSLLELFRLTVSRGLNANDVMDILRIINTGEFEYMQRIQSRMNALTWVDNEIKKKEYHLRTVNNRIREFSYREWDIIPMTNSANEPTYRPDNTYPSLPDDTSIKPIPYMWDDMKQ